MSERIFAPPRRRCSARSAWSGDGSDRDGDGRASGGVPDRSERVALLDIGGYELQRLQRQAGMELAMRTVDEILRQTA